MRMWCMHVDYMHMDDGRRSSHYVHVFSHKPWWLCILFHTSLGGCVSYLAMRQHNGVGNFRDFHKFYFQTRSGKFTGFPISTPLCSRERVYTRMAMYILVYTCIYSYASTDVPRLDADKISRKFFNFNFLIFNFLIFNF